MESIFGAEKKRISPWPKLVCRTSAFGMLSSAIATCVGMSLDASPSVVLSFLAAAYMALVPAYVSGKSYIDQKRNEGLLSCKNTEKGEFYQRVAVTSASIAISSGVAALVTIPAGYSLDAYNSTAVVCGSAMMAACLAEGVMGISYELRDAANIKLLRREVDSLDESSERKDFGLLKHLNLIGKLNHRKKPSEVSNLLEEFKVNEDTVPLIERGMNLRSNFSGANYGTATGTSKTTSLL